MIVAKTGGRSLWPEQPPRLTACRSLYLIVDRYNQATVPATFDFANPDTIARSTSRRYRAPAGALPHELSPSWRINRSKAGCEVAGRNGSGIDLQTMNVLYRKVLLRASPLQTLPSEVEMAARAFVNDAVRLAVQAVPSWEYGYGAVQAGACSERNPVTVTSSFPSRQSYNGTKKGIVWQVRERAARPGRFTHVRVSTQWVGQATLEASTWPACIRWTGPF